MTIEDLAILHEDLCREAKETMIKKNHDYTCGSSDPFANFRASEILGIPPEQSILVRVLDKMERLNTAAVKKKLHVAESVQDSIQDIINYMVLLAGLFKEKESDSQRISRSSE